MKFYSTPKELVAEQDQFETDIKAYTRGDINPVKFKAIRVAHGVYEQRQEHTYMIRIRCAAGGITPAQLKKTAELAQEYGSGEVHFTTRQEVQVHNVLVQDVLAVIRGLHTVGLSTRGGGGNTIRNILTPPLSGIDPAEVFDVDPYAIALTTRMIAEPDSWNLPRKFKIAFSNNAADISFTQATCLGFVATEKDGQQGFEVYTAGGMGAKPMVGHLLMDFIPANRVYHVTKAIKIMFDKNGNRRSKYSSRIKFLWKKVQEQTFKDLFYEEYNQLKDDDSLNLVLEPIHNQAKSTITLEPERGTSEAFTLFKQRFVTPQKQAGLYTIKLPLVLGDLLYRDACRLCDFLAHFGDNTIRCDRAQNMRIRNIPEAYLGNLFALIQRMEYTLADHAAFIGNMINCTGAQTCKLGICLPRGLSTALRDRLMNSDLNLDAIPEFQLNMSGCPNTCGMHHVADLGFFGKIGRKNGEIYPAYNILAGAQRGAGITQYAQKEGDLPAHALPEFVYRFLKGYIEEKEEYPTYQAYLDAEGRELIKALCEQLKDVPTLEEDSRYYYDFGSEKRLRLDDMGTAECSAGMFDMITVDRRAIETELKTHDPSAPIPIESLYTILFHTARMLLVTRGLDGKTTADVLGLFAKHFVQTELVSLSYLDLVNAAKEKKDDIVIANQDRVVALSEAVQELYKTMDDSLRFRTPKPKEGTTPATQSASVVVKDFRGVSCPMNFVKTKLALDTIASQAIIDVLLDDGEPIQNVPNSVKLEGHKIVSQAQDATGYWTVRIKKQ